MSEFPDTYDAILEKHRGALPLAYLKALARGESNFNPALVHPGGATGLLQVVQAPLDDYNKAHGTSWTKADMTNPERNVAVACWTLNRIVSAYADSGFGALKPNWSSIRWVTLLTLGWNAGWSKAGGVQKVVAYLYAAQKVAQTIGKETLVDKLPAVRLAKYLLSLGESDRPMWLRNPDGITGDDVVAHAKDAEASKNLWTASQGGKGTAKLAWCKKVVAWYQELLRLPLTPGGAKGGSSWVLLLLLLVLSRRKRT